MNQASRVAIQQEHKAQQKPPLLTRNLGEAYDADPAEARDHFPYNPPKPNAHAHTRSPSTSRYSLEGFSTQRIRGGSSSVKSHSRQSSIPLSSNPLSPPPILSAPYALPAMSDVTLEGLPKGSWLDFYNKNRGLAYVLLAQVFGCLMNVTTRLLEIEGNHGEGMHPFQILFVRMTITTTLSTIYMYWSKIPHLPFGLPEVRWLLLGRGIGGFFGVFGMYYSLLYLPLADATVITFISPCISCFACSFLIKEPFTRMEQMGALISFVGVTLIARPTTFFHHGVVEAPPPDADASHANSDYNRVTSSQRFGAVSVALVGVLGQALAFTTMRWMGKRAHPLLSVNYFCAMCTIVSALAMVTLPGVPFLLPADAKEWGYLIFLGICGFAMQFLLSAGLQIEKSSRATNMVYTQMLFALLFDKMVFGTNPSALSLLGSTLILGSALYVAMQKESQKQKADAEKVREETATREGREMEMGLRPVPRPSHDAGKPDEERGLMAGEIQAETGQAEFEHVNGGVGGANGHAANGHAANGVVANGAAKV